VVAGICHGVLVLARSGVLKGVRTTTLPVWMEKFAYYSTAPFLGGYYRTYPQYTADEVKSLSQYEPGSLGDTKPFLVEDESYFYLSGRYPGDAEMLGKRMVEMLKEVDEGS